MRFDHPYKQYLGKWIKFNTPDEEGNKFFLLSLKEKLTTTGRAVSQIPEEYFETVDFYAAGQIEIVKVWIQRSNLIGQEPGRVELTEPTHKDVKRLFSWIFKGMKDEV